MSRRAEFIKHVMIFVRRAEDYKRVIGHLSMLQNKSAKMKIKKILFCRKSEIIKSKKQILTLNNSKCFWKVLTNLSTMNNLKAFMCII